MHGKRPSVSSLNGIVAAAHPHAARAGAKILDKGGNAFDAVAATAAALNVVEPYMSSLAGMGLACMWVAKRRRCARSTSCRRSLRSSRSRSSRHAPSSSAGPIGPAHPGNLAGWAELNKKYGKLPLGDCLQPAIALARDGYPITEFNVEETNLTGPEIAKYPALYGPWVKNYTDGNGTVALGQVLKQPDLAKTFEAIAKNGPQHLYGGALGKKMVDHLKANGGSVTMADLEAMLGETGTVWTDAMPRCIATSQVHTPPPPCEGFQFLLTLRILDGFDLAHMQNNGIEHLDTVVRAIRLAAGVRIANNFASPEKAVELMSDAAVAKLRDRVRDGKPIDGPTEQWVRRPATRAASTTPPRSRSPTRRATSSA